MKKQHKKIISSLLLVGMCLGSYSNVYAADLNHTDITNSEVTESSTQNIEPRVTMEKWVEYKKALRHGEELPPEGDTMYYEVELAGILFQGVLTFSRELWEYPLRYALYTGYVFAQS